MGDLLTTIRKYIDLLEAKCVIFITVKTIKNFNSLCICVFNSHSIVGALHGFAASPIAFISHERKQVVIQFLTEQYGVVFLKK